LENDIHVDGIVEWCVFGCYFFDFAFEVALWFEIEHHKFIVGCKINRGDWWSMEFDFGKLLNNMINTSWLINVRGTKFERIGTPIKSTIIWAEEDSIKGMVDFNSGNLLWKINVFKLIKYIIGTLLFVNSYNHIDISSYKYFIIIEIIMDRFWSIYKFFLFLFRLFVLW
jgi:hypothetical protein